MIWPFRRSRAVDAEVDTELRYVHGTVTVENGIANVKSGIRRIRKSPTFSLAIILTLSLGIGANSALFSALNSVLFRPLAFPNADELTIVYQVQRHSSNPSSFVAPVRLLDWERLNRTYQAISGWYTEDASENSGLLPEKVTLARIAPHFLQVWAISPALGRDVSGQEEHFGGPNVALISDGFWHRRFHADANVLGRHLRFEKSSFTIIAVLPASFRFPDHNVDVWAPNPMDAPIGQDRNATWFNVFGRLKPGVSIAEARADLNDVQTQLGPNVSGLGCQAVGQDSTAEGSNYRRCKKATMGLIRLRLSASVGRMYEYRGLVACTQHRT